MNAAHIENALNIPFFNGHFKGILYSDKLKLSEKNHEVLDFYVINTNHIFGEHWFGCIYIENKWIIFDSSTFTPSKYHNNLMEALYRTSSKNVQILFDSAQLQRPEALTCGLHTISFIYFTFNKFIKKTKSSYKQNQYCNKLINFCKIIHNSPDDFVYKCVYNSGIFNIEKEDPKAIKLWLGHFNYE